MDESPDAATRTPVLPVILIAAVLQGWSLYGLHHAIKTQHWPATSTAWLIALYALAFALPLTVQLLAEHIRKPIAKFLLMAMALSFFYFGWHQGNHVSLTIDDRMFDSGALFPFVPAMVVLWLLALPFMQHRLTTGSWQTHYDFLFTTAWRNKLMLAEAAAFTGLFWALLELWQLLFHMLNIDFFRDLFKEPLFVYPVTALCFGCALHLIGSIERLTSLVLEQALNVLKWLAPLAIVILTLFSVALMTKLPTLVFAGQKAIGASWLLWLTAFTVLLLNAAYRDGSVNMPYPFWIAQGIKWLVPLTMLIAVTAIYALFVRADHYGLTVDRVWALIVAGMALYYAIGYSMAAFGQGRWLAGMARVNVSAALTLIVIIAATLTPLLSPYRLAANSQFKQAQKPSAQTDPAQDASYAGNYQNSPFFYLKFAAGQYGVEKLRELTTLQGGADAARIRKQATSVLAQKNRWGGQPPANADEILANLKIYPDGHALENNLRTQLIADLKKTEHEIYFTNDWKDVAGIFVDLNNDQSDEFLLIAKNSGLAYENRNSQWHLLGEVSVRGKNPSAANSLETDLMAGSLSVSPPAWNDLTVGSRVFRVTPAP